ncbi:MAG: hypothetical protein LBQ14_08370 [Treponema sp.]|jgi:hypothetical protein|nr:hypothetical protein [Treponema sp.]
MNNKKKVYLVLVILALAVSPAFTQTSVDIRNAYDAFTDLGMDVARGLTFNSTLGLNWSDAYIGQILNKAPEKLVNKPPHFGIGVMAGVTSISKDKVLDALKKAGIDSSDFDDIFAFALPAAAGELRLGGFFLPFDLGVKAGVLPSLDIGDMNLSYTFVGFDVRYALLKEESRGWKPNISVGAGFNYIREKFGGISVGSGPMTWTVPSGINGTTGGIVSLSAPSLDLDWSNMTLDLKAQVSKRLIYIFTPYLGLGGSFGWSTFGYGLNSNIGYTLSGGGGPGTMGNLRDDLAKLGIPFDVDATSLSGEEKVFTAGFRAYGGLAINIWKIILDVTGMYNFLDQNYGASVGLRVQI